MRAGTLLFAPLAHDAARCDNVDARPCVSPWRRTQGREHRSCRPTSTHSPTHSATPTPTRDRASRFRARPTLPQHLIPMLHFSWALDLLKSGSHSRRAICCWPAVPCQRRSEAASGAGSKSGAVDVLALICGADVRRRRAAVKRARTGTCLPMMQELSWRANRQEASNGAFKDRTRGKDFLVLAGALDV